MTGLPDSTPDSLAIALWVVGSCWAVAVVAYLFDAADGLVVPLVLFGTLTGVAELLLRRKPR
jgi:hypothetical protein